jgi:probable rRNA maturation factor
LGCQKGELSILLLDDEGIRELNRTYLKRNRPTDVISFPQNEVLCRPAGRRLLGDVAISVETAQRQAAQAGEPLREEFAFLLIHGILHLLGYDHQGSARMARTMTARGRKLLHVCKIQRLF